MCPLILYWVYRKTAEDQNHTQFFSLLLMSMLNIIESSIIFCFTGYFGLYMGSKTMELTFYVIKNSSVLGLFFNHLKSSPC